MTALSCCGTLVALSDDAFGPRDIPNHREARRARTIPPTRPNP
jgi:hypothetical protein